MPVHGSREKAPWGASRSAVGGGRVSVGGPQPGTCFCKSLGRSDSRWGFGFPPPDQFRQQTPPHCSWFARTVMGPGWLWKRCRVSDGHAPTLPSLPRRQQVPPPSYLRHLSLCMGGLTPQLLVTPPGDTHSQ